MKRPSTSPPGTSPPETLRDHLIGLELRLLEPAVRASREALDSLLAEAFHEIGANGRRFGKDEALDRLPTEFAPKFTQRDFELHQLSPDIAQLVYKATLERPGDPAPRHSLRSSLWRLEEDRWRMVFHQGTPCDPF